MVYIGLGIIAFVLMYIFDIFTLYNYYILKKVFGISGMGLIVYASIEVLLNSNILAIPLFIRIISLLFCILFLLLLFYSLFLELPFMKTYGEETHNHDLVDRGTYALCRHPGVLWFGLTYLFLFIASEKIDILYAGIIWTIIDVFYVVMQEKTIFKKMFPNYSQYQKTTPMLIPTVRSIKKCIKTLGGKYEDA